MSPRAVPRGTLDCTSEAPSTMANRVMGALSRVHHRSGGAIGRLAQLASNFSSGRFFASRIICITSFELDALLTPAFFAECAMIMDVPQIEMAAVMAATMIVWRILLLLVEQRHAPSRGCTRARAVADQPPLRLSARRPFTNPTRRAVPVVTGARFCCRCSRIERPLPGPNGGRDVACFIGVCRCGRHPLA